MKHTHVFILLLIVILGAIFRFTGLNWDANSHLHPDERFLTMVATALSWPKDISNYFDTDQSSFNPHNNNFSFYVYGTYPLHLTKLIASALQKDTYDGIPLVGRTLSGLADLVTLVLVFLIAKYVASSDSRLSKFASRVGLFAAFCYAVAILPIQLSHFFTVDPYVTLFTTLALWHIVRGKIGLPLGIVVGLAISAKISAALILPLILVTFLLTWPWTKRGDQAKQIRWQLLGKGLLFSIGLLATIRIMYPYLFRGIGLNQLVLANWKQLASFDGPTTGFPPGIQWINVPFWQPTLDIFVWGLGLPLGLFAVVALLSPLKTFFATRKWHPQLILVLWTILVACYQSFQFAKPMRYLYPVYPSLAVLTGIFLARVFQRIEKKYHPGQLVYILLCFLFIAWPLSFLSIYMHPNTRVSASNWIYTHIPQGQTIAWEHWDDPLPFAIRENNPSIYRQIQLPSFDPDDADKGNKIATTLSTSDYLVLSSNRAYGALERAITRFPLMHRFYQKLFSGLLGYTLAAQFISRPNIPFPSKAMCLHIPGFTYGILSKQLEQCTKQGLSIVDDYTDEMFTVYDHPKVLIFRNTAHLSSEELITSLYE